jgi:pilus assembly protein Flp/PilA
MPVDWFTRRCHPFTGVAPVIRHFMHQVRAFLKDDSGPTAVEYAIMLALITAVCVASVSTLATSIDQSFTVSADTIANAFGN